jgi:outer membrane protein OmpA-like peptidoglycan-associated protein
VKLYRITLYVAMVGLTYVLTAVPLGAQAQDFRGRGTYTDEELKDAIIRTRGLTPVEPSPAATQPPPAPSPSDVPSPVQLNVFFEFDSDRIRSQFYGDLDKLGRALTSSELASVTIEVAGHTDSRGSVAYNQNLSERRAQSVKRYLVRQFDISPQRLKVRGYGEEAPMASNETQEGRAKNRRVEVRALD